MINRVVFNLNFENLKNIKIGEWIIIFSPFLVLIFYKICSLLRIETVCLWKLLTGHDCIGCGITHAIVALLKGHFRQAFEYNPFVIVVFPILLFSWLNYIYKRFSGNACS